MKKSAVSALALTLALGMTTVANAAENTYTVKAGTSPAKAGSKKKPVPVGISFGYQVGEAAGLRPEPVKRYSIAFDGLRVNTNVIPKCNAPKELKKASGKATKETTKRDLMKKACKKAIVGAGKVNNATGATSNPSDRSIPCDLDLILINMGNNKLGLYLTGGPQPRSGESKCTIDVDEVIVAKFKKQGKATALVFDVPQLLLHPLPGLSNAVESVESKIKKLTGKKKGKKVGYYESIGGCKKGKRAVTVTFTTESGKVGKAVAAAKC